MTAVLCVSFPAAGYFLLTTEAKAVFFHFFWSLFLHDFLSYALALDTEMVIDKQARAKKVSKSTSNWGIFCYYKSLSKE